jgi:glucokinase
VESTEPHLICAVDLGGTNLRAANIDSAGTIRDRRRTPTPATAKAQEIVNAIASLVRECKGEAKSRGQRVSAVSIVIPGSVQAETGVVVNAPNVPAMVNFQLGEALTTAIAGPVLLENDANAAALGEMWKGAARAYRTSICLTLGTGVGGGIILDGHLWRGVDGTGGEIGHMSLEPFGNVRCNCGNTGCLEVYASATAIVRITRAALPSHPSSSLQQLPPEQLTAVKISEAARAGDQLAVEIFKQMGRYLGVALASLANIFNPEVIVIGGGVSAAFDLFAPAAEAELTNRAFPVPARRCRIVRGVCGDDAGLLGAAWLALAKM